MGQWAWCLYRPPLCSEAQLWKQLQQNLPAWNFGVKTGTLCAASLEVGPASPWRNDREPGDSDRDSRSTVAAAASALGSDLEFQSFAAATALL